MGTGIWLRGPSPHAQGTLAKAVCDLPWGCGLILPAASKAIGGDGNCPDVKPSWAN